MKKHYKSAAHEQAPSGFALLLDGRPARTPMDNPFVMPDEAIAAAVAEEWRSQGDVIRKETMPLTRLACAAIDHFSDQKHRAAEMNDLLAYSETDLVCYRAGDAPALSRRQAELLDPILAWAEERFAIAFTLTGGVMPVSQPDANWRKLSQALSGLDLWKFAALAFSVRPLGSLVLALALVEDRIGPDAAFQLAHLEETHETEKWGSDEEKEAKLEGKRKEMAAIGRFLALLREES